MPPFVAVPGRQLFGLSFICCVMMLTAVHDELGGTPVGALVQVTPGLGLLRRKAPKGEPMCLHKYRIGLEGHSPAPQRVCCALVNKTKPQP